MPAGYEDQMAMPSMGGDASGGGLPGMENYSPEELRNAMAQIMAKNAPQGSGQPSPEDLWALQGQKQMGMPPVPQFNIPPGPNPGMTVPSMQAQPPQPGLNLPQAPAGPGAPGGVPPLPPEIGAFPGNKGLTVGGEGGGGPGGGTYGLPKSPRGRF